MEEAVGGSSAVATTTTTREILAAYFGDIVAKHFPQDSNEKIQKGMPFVGASILMWPLFWLYRGLDWGHQRQYVTLPVYIQKVGKSQQYMRQMRAPK